MKKINLIMLVALSGLFTAIYAQVEQQKTLTYSDFIDLVRNNNIEYAAEKFDVAMAEAEILSARAFEDPELSVGYFDNGERKKQMGYGYESELEWTLELGGKRKARINLAKSEYALSQSILLNYFKNLRADATLAYFEALQNKKVLEVKINSYESMNELAKSDSIRFKLGDISEVDAKQSKVEAITLKNDVFVAEAAYKNALINLNLLMGNFQAQAYQHIIENFPVIDKSFSLEYLIYQAQENRSDLVAALQSKEVSKRNVALAKANRAIDLGLKVNVEYNSIVRNEEAESPRFTKVGGGIAIPLKFSNRRNNDWKIAKMDYEKTERLYDLALLEVSTQVQQAYNTFIAHQEQVKAFNTGLLEKAKAVLDGKTYSYKRGDTSLLEVLDAQRTHNEVQEEYYEALYNYLAALVELERATGTWDIVF
ncbi:TolC family protein [Flavobacterium agricola]|uniref:TolC family protein n=1 Tax=Flavobacterium agricola TaxID=2870839 RepID=A0ABY6M1H4_9FLAO|nr:TolC family protein [Flavobacterium agricola]UYW01078.1 TolC family protein [Flavobacterium agricola]